MDKVIALEDVPSLVNDGDTVLVHGFALSAKPIAMLRQIIRSGKKNLTLVTPFGDLDADLMVGAGCVDRILYSFVSLWYFGQAPNLRRAIDRAQVTCEEYTVISLEKRLEAGARGMPFLPFRGPWDSELAATSYGREALKFLDCPFTGQKVWAARELLADIALVHADRGDPHGNVQFNGASFGHSHLAKTVIVSVEEMQSVSATRRRSADTGIPGAHVDGVVEVPFGAHPNACPGRYVQDVWHWREYVDAATSEELFSAYLDQYVHGCLSHAEYLERVGGVRTVMKLGRLTKEGSTYGDSDG